MLKLNSIARARKDLEKTKIAYFSFKEKVADFLKNNVDPLGKKETSINAELAEINGQLAQVRSGVSAKPPSASEILEGTENTVFPGVLQQRAKDLHLELNRVVDEKKVLLKKHKILGDEQQKYRREYDDARAELYLLTLKKEMDKAGPGILRILGLTALYISRKDGYGNEIPKISPVEVQRNIAVRKFFGHLAEMKIIDASQIDCAGLYEEIEG